VTTILLSASGSPGSARLIRALHENRERSVRIVGTDMNENAIGRFLCDAFHVVPPGSDPGYADAILGLVEQEGVDVVLPQSSFDLQALSEVRERFPVPVLVSSPDTIHRSNDKAETYALLQRIGVPTVEFRRVAGAQQVEAAARELGYPERPVCFKPVFSSGSRGFRILDPTVDRAHQLLHERWSLQRAASARSTASPTGSASCSAIRRRARRCAPGSRCTSSRLPTTS
jgi:carbamoyl-phosphate synthase large subunit